MTDHAAHALQSEQRAPVPPPACPRCGYRFDGVVASWARVCPLFGTCAECGDAINWSQVLVPHKHEPRWSFEHAPRRRLAPTLVWTTLNLLRPKRFWTQIKMSDAVRHRRLAAYLAGILVPWALVWIALQTGASFAYWRLVQNGELSLHAERAAMLDAPLRVRAAARQTDGRAILPDQLPTPWPIVLDGWMRPFGRHAHYPITIDGEAWVIHDQGAWTRLGEIARSVSYGHAYRLHNASEGAAIGLGAGLIVTTVMPLLFVLMPWTRARCGVRRRHLVRIWVYGVPMMIMITVVMIIFATASSAVFQRTQWVSTLLVPAFVYVWWGWAMSCHLRLPRPWFVAGLLMVISLLVVAFIFIATSLPKLMGLLQ